MLICANTVDGQIMFKMDLNGNGNLVEQCHLNKALGLHSDSYTFDKFRYACILSGCDYVASLPGIGLAKATKVFRLSRQTDIAMVSDAACLCNLSTIWITAVVIIESLCLIQWCAKDQMCPYKLSC